MTGYEAARYGNNCIDPFLRLKSHAASGLFVGGNKCSVPLLFGSDVNKDWTCNDKDKDQAYKDQDKNKD